MKLSDIIRTLNDSFPFTWAYDWDNVGLLIGDEEAEVTRVLTALDVTDETCEAAVERGANLIITHHPLLFRPTATVREQDFIGRRVRKLIRHDINYIALHTNFDIARMGALNAEALGLIRPEILEEAPQSAEAGEGLGRIGALAGEMTLADFTEVVKEAFALPAVRAYGNPEMRIRRAAVSSGSGRSSIPSAIEKGADVIVTGDVDYHTAIDALAKGISVIDAGHYGTEFVFISYMKKYIGEHFPELAVDGMPVRQPYTVL